MNHRLLRRFQCPRLRRLARAGKFVPVIFRLIINGILISCSLSNIDETIVRFDLLVVHSLFKNGEEKAFPFLDIPQNCKENPTQQKLPNQVNPVYGFLILLPAP